MQLALIVGARPQYMRMGPVVRLEAGKWRVTCDNHRDSVLGIRFHSDSPASELVKQELDGRAVTIDGPGLIQVEIIKPGTESYISAFAHKL